MPMMPCDAAGDHLRWPSRSPAKRCPAMPIVPVHRRVPMCRSAQAEQAAARGGSGGQRGAAAIPCVISAGEGARTPPPCLVWARGLLSAQPRPWWLGTPLPTHLL